MQIYTLQNSKRWDCAMCLSKDCHVYRQHKEWWWFIYFIAMSRAYSMLVPACDTQIRGQLDGMTKQFGQHSAWFYRWWCFEWLYVSRTQNKLLSRYQSKQTFPEPVVCPAQTWCWRGRMRWDGGGRKRKTVAFCHATFHLHLQFPMEDVLWIFYIVSSDTPHKSI